MARCQEAGQAGFRSIRATGADAPDPLRDAVRDGHSPDFPDTLAAHRLRRLALPRGCARAVARPHSSACAALARLALRTSGIQRAPRAGLPPVLRAGSSGVRHAMALAGRAFARLPASALAALPAEPLAADRGRYSVSICIWPSTLMSRPDSCSGSCLLRLLESRSFALSSSRSAFIFS